LAGVCGSMMSAACRSARAIRSRGLSIRSSSTSSDSSSRSGVRSSTPGSSPPFTTRPALAALAVRRAWSARWPTTVPARRLPSASLTSSLLGSASAPGGPSGVPCCVSSDTGITPRPEAGQHDVCHQQERFLPGSDFPRRSPLSRGPIVPESLRGSCKPCAAERCHLVTDEGGSCHPSRAVFQEHGPEREFRPVLREEPGRMRTRRCYGQLRPFIPQVLDRGLRMLAGGSAGSPGASRRVIAGGGAGRSGAARRRGRVVFPGRTGRHTDDWSALTGHWPPAR
jgi:hypothetical protein